MYIYLIFQKMARKDFDIHSFIQLNFIKRYRQLLHLQYQLLTVLQYYELYTLIHLLGEPARAGF